MKNIAYIDGSYNPKNNTCGAGVVFFDSDGQRYLFHYTNKDDSMADMGSVCGEILAAELAIEIAQKFDMKFLRIFYDFKGIGCWAKGEWKAKNKYTRDYVKIVDNALASGMEINFNKISAHSGNEFNDLADQIAKEACDAVSVTA